MKRKLHTNTISIISILALTNASPEIVKAKFSISGALNPWDDQLYNATVMGTQRCLCSEFLLGGGGMNVTASFCDDYNDDGHGHHVRNENVLRRRSSSSNSNGTVSVSNRMRLSMDRVLSETVETVASISSSGMLYSQVFVNIDVDQEALSWSNDFMDGDFVSMDDLQEDISQAVKECIDPSSSDVFDMLEVMSGLDERVWNVAEFGKEDEVFFLRQEISSDENEIFSLNQDIPEDSKKGINQGTRPQALHPLRTLGILLFLFTGTGTYALFVTASQRRRVRQRKLQRDLTIDDLKSSEGADHPFVIAYSC